MELNAELIPSDYALTGMVGRLYQKLKQHRAIVKSFVCTCSFSFWKQAVSFTIRVIIGSVLLGDLLSSNDCRFHITTQLIWRVHKRKYNNSAINPRVD